MNDGLTYMKRTLFSNESKSLMYDIIKEGFDYINACEYESGLSYRDYLIEDSAVTYLHHYIDPYIKGEKSKIFEDWKVTISDIMKKNYGNWVLRRWKDEIELCKESDNY